MIEKYRVVTISHQLGSGGAYLGQKLSERLGIPFLDREILKKVSTQLNLAENSLAGREERLSSFWESFSRLAILADPAQNISAAHYEPSDADLFRVESETIERIANRGPAIIIGRCGRHILRNHPGHFSILVLAELPARIERICRLYHVNEERAEKIVMENDRERAAYIKTFTGEDWLDARLYDLSLNTTRLGFDLCVELALTALKARSAG